PPTTLFPYTTLFRSNWTAKFCSYVPDALKPIGLITLHDVPAAIAEMRRAATEMGFTAVTLARIPDGKVAGDLSHEPFYAACEELDRKSTRLNSSHLG